MIVHWWSALSARRSVPETRTLRGAHDRTSRRVADIVAVSPDSRWTHMKRPGSVAAGFSRQQLLLLTLRGRAESRSRR